MTRIGKLNAKSSRKSNAPSFASASAAISSSTWSIVVPMNADRFEIADLEKKGSNVLL